MRTDIDNLKDKIINRLQQGEPQASVARDLKCKIHTLRTRLKAWGLEHLCNPSRKGLPHPEAYKPASNYLKENCSSITSWSLKNKLFKENIKEKKCDMCLNTEWLGKPIPLELEHVNGIHTDNRIENLKILCPNCHYFTPTYKTKNRKDFKKNMGLLAKSV